MRSSVSACTFRSALRGLRAAGFLGLGLAAVSPRGTAEGFFSLTGRFADAADALDLGLALDASVGSAETLRFETFSFSGGVNAAGAAIPAGGFDPRLRLFDGLDAQVGSNNNAAAFPLNDALLSWPGVADQGGTLTVDPLPAGDYRLTLDVSGGSGFVPGQGFALDVVGPDALSLEALVGTGGVGIDGLVFGRSLPIGGPTRWTSLTGHIVGGSGAPQLVEVRAGGWIEAPSLTVAPGFGDTGSVLVSGADGRVVAQDVSVGVLGGVGVLAMDGGATLTADDVTVGANPAGPFTATDGPMASALTLHGTGTTGTIQNALVVGDNDLSGRLEVRGGAVLTAGSADLGSRTVPSRADVLVSDAGSMLDVIGVLSVAANGGSDVGTASVTVENGGVVRSGELNFAEFASPAVLTVRGAGSRFETGLAYFGNEGDPVVVVENGGRLVTGDTSFVFQPGIGAFGDARITGAGSTWEVEGDLYVAGADRNDFAVEGLEGGEARVRLRDGGQLMVAGDAVFGQLSFFGDTRATLDVDQGTVNVQGNLEVAVADAPAALAFRGGSALLTGNASISVPEFEEDGGDGRLALTDSTWTNTGQLDIGYDDTDVSGSGVVDLGRLAQLDNGGAINVWTNGQLNALNATIQAESVVNRGDVVLTDSGLTANNGVENRGTMVLIRSTLDGDLLLPAGEALDVVGNVSITGTLSGAGSVFGSGTLTLGGVSPGSSAGTLSIEHDAALAADGRVEIELGVAENDLLQAGGSLSVAGPLELLLLDGYDPAVGEVFTVVDAGALSGVFSSVAGVEVDGGFALAVTYAADSVLVTVAMPGDADLNGQVEQGDLDAVLQNWGLTAAQHGISWATGDLNGSGQVEQGDLDAVLINWGSAAAPGFALNPGVVPEPGGIVVVMSTLGLAWRRRRV